MIGAESPKKNSQKQPKNKKGIKAKLPEHQKKKIFLEKQRKPSTKKARKLRWMVEGSHLRKNKKDSRKKKAGTKRLQYSFQKPILDFLTSTLKNRKKNFTQEKEEKNGKIGRKRPFTTRFGQQRK